MVLERTEILVREGTEAAFAKELRERGRAMLADIEGVSSAQTGQGVENPAKFLLLLEWDSMEAHAAYNGSAAQTAFRALVAPYGVGGAMEHFDLS